MTTWFCTKCLSKKILALAWENVQKQICKNEGEKEEDNPGLAVWPEFCKCGGVTHVHQTGKLWHGKKALKNCGGICKLFSKFN